MLNTLLEYGAVSSKKNKIHDNPLHTAAMYNRLFFIRQFLKLEYDPSSKFQVSEPSVKVINLNSQTPLMVAVAYGNQTCVEELARDKNIELGANKNLNNEFHLCAEFKNIVTFNYFIKFYPEDINKNLLLKNYRDETIFHIACRSGDIEIIKSAYDQLRIQKANKEILYHKNQRPYSLQAELMTSP